MSNLFIPNTAPIPNVIFDYWMSRLSPAEFKVLMCVARKTYGWHKIKDAISLTQMEKMSGLSRFGIGKCLKTLIEKNLVIKIKNKTPKGDDDTSIYEINVNCMEEGRQPSLPPVGNSVAPPVGNSVAPQKTLYTKDNTTNMSEPPFGRIALYFFEKISEINPKVTKPNLDKWAKEIKCLSKDGEGNSEEEIRGVIDYVISTHSKPSANGFCWANNVQSAASLRKNFAKLWAEMNGKKESQPTSDENRKLAESIIKKIKREDIILGPDYLEFINGVNAPSTVLEFKSKDFKVRVLEQLDKRKLPSNGL